MFKKICLMQSGQMSLLTSRGIISTRSCHGTVTESNRKQKRRKSPKYLDPNYPKRPLNAYLRFWLQFQPEFMDKNKNVNLAKSAKIAGNEWYHLGDIQRAQYQRESESEWNTFTEKIKEYRENDGFAKWKETKESLPKKMYPKSPVAIYIRENYQKCASMVFDEAKPAKDIMRKLAEQWTEEGEEVKGHYKTIWSQEKQEFLSKYGQYLKNTEHK